ncbi:death domain-containing protein CRADD [Pseudoliparis swirei]|uniref:death domain-containing protein CRADD n=1 Tax=Pseudoliparis swirei TaxID=2059687 RepID=UPI0024BD96EC|nr:death domain-containing protein CRADD [Pseudoliparis swirei]
MEPAHRALLRTHRLYLSGQLLVSDGIVPLLYQEDILSARQVEDIEAQPTSTLRCLRLLDLLPARGPRAFHCFLRSLEDFDWVRDKLLLELQTGPGPGPGPGPSASDLRLPDSVLQQVPSDRVLSRLVSRLGSEWEPVLMDLGLSAEDLFRCRSDHRLSTHGAVMAGLVRWRQLGGKTATVQRLLRSLQDAGVHPSVLEDVLL